MGQRIVRVNELLKREISQILRQRFQSEAVRISITGVETSPDLRQAQVFYSVLGDATDVQKARRFFKNQAGRIRFLVGQVIVLKYLPYLSFKIDHSIERGAQLLDRMDELADESGE